MAETKNLKLLRSFAALRMTEGKLRMTERVLMITGDPDLLVFKPDVLIPGSLMSR